MKDLSERIAAEEAEFAREAEGFPDLSKDPGFVFEGLRLDAVLEVRKAMEASGISQAELARRLGCSAQNVSRMLRDEANFTLAMLAKLAVALDRDFGMRLFGKDEEVVVRKARVRIRRSAKTAPKPRTEARKRS
ncbi:MAG: helix-turn-helix transcriptional regulator [Candidatus Sumerlaeia bacterium]|nr:helix-turn-helix transcriptional regulator [Candidatus Sumerlaeia bacterium]